MESHTVARHEEPRQRPASRREPAAEASGWAPADPGRSAWRRFALTTFVLSMFNANLVSHAGEPVVLGLALAYGGIAQMLAGMWEFRTGNTFGAVAFTSFGAFWLSFWALVTFFADEIPAEHLGAALGLYLIAWGIFTLYMFIASLRTTAAIALVFAPACRDLLPARDRQRERKRKPGRSRRLVRPGHGGRCLVCIICSGHQFDLRADGSAGPAARIAEGGGVAGWQSSKERPDQPRARARGDARDRDVRAAGGVPRAGALERPGGLRGGGRRPRGLVDARRRTSCSTGTPSRARGSTTPTRPSTSGSPTAG